MLLIAAGLIAPLGLPLGGMRSYASLPLVSNHVTSSVLALDVEDSLRDAALLLKRAGITGAPVCEDGSLAGILSRNDMLRTIAAMPSNISPEEFDEKLKEIQSRDVWRAMDASPTTILPDETLRKAAHVMGESKLNRLIVQPQYGAFLGILTSTDVVFALLGSTSEAAQAVDVNEYTQNGMDYSTTEGCSVGTLVGSYMTSSVLVMPPDMTLHDAACLLRAARVTGAPVVEDGKLLGVISRNGLLRTLSTVVSEDASEAEFAAKMEEMKASPVREVMSTDQATISADALMIDAAKLLANERLNRLMVTGTADSETGTPTLLGILSSSDVVFGMLGCDYRLVGAGGEVPIDGGALDGIFEDERRRGNMYRKGIY